MGTPEQREAAFWAKVQAPDDPLACWNWQGCHIQNGYGQFWGGAKVLYVHRYVYELMVAPIPRGLSIDHLCRNKVCVNPYHMEVVTIAENTRRMQANRKVKA